MRILEQKQCVVGCPTEEEMDKEIMLMLIEQYKLWELALKIYKKGYDEWYKDWYEECCNDLGY